MTNILKWMGRGGVGNNGQKRLVGSLLVFNSTQGEVTLRWTTARQLLDTPAVVYTSCLGQTFIGWHGYWVMQLITNTSSSSWVPWMWIKSWMSHLGRRGMFSFFFFCELEIDLMVKYCALQILRLGKSSVCHILLYFPKAILMIIFFFLFPNCICNTTCFAILLMLKVQKLSTLTGEEKRDVSKEDVEMEGKHSTDHINHLMRQASALQKVNKISTHSHCT